MKRKTSFFARLLGTASALTLAVTMLFPVNGAAAEALQIGIDGYAVEDGKLKIYVNQNQGESFMVTPDYTEVYFGGNQMTTEAIKSFGDTNEPVSYKCVVDISGSMSQDRIDFAKDVIKKLSEIKKPEDKIAITAMGNELTQSGYMTDPAEIAQYADYLTLTHEDTNLYYAITEELNGLRTVADAAGKSCLVIFSDGADYQDTGLTKDEAENAAKTGRTPIFTIGLLKNAKSENDKEMAKVLGSFARLSPGGVHYVPALDESTVDSIAEGIQNTLNSSFVLYEDLEDVSVSGKEVALKVSVSSQYSETATDTITLPESDVKIIQDEIVRIEEAKATPTPEPTADPMSDEEEDQGADSFILFGYPVPKLYVYIGAALLLLLAVLLIVLLTKKNKDKATPEEPYGEYAENQTVREDGGNMPTGYASTGMADDASVTQGFAAPGGGMESVTMPVGQMPGMNNTGSVTVAATSAAPVSGGINVTMVRMGKGEEKKYQLALGSDKYTIGRSAAQSKLAFSDDSALSGLHCSMLAKNGRVYLKDEKSTNGTFVNGVPIEGQFELNRDDVILIGSYEYRVFWG